MATETSAWMNRIRTTPMNAMSPYSWMYPTDVAESEPEAVVAKSANASTIVAAITDWVVEAMCGLLCFSCVRPSAVGSTRSRPSE